MSRLLASALAAVLLLSSGAEAVVWAAGIEPPCAGDCGCAEDVPAGPALEHSCCCTAVPADQPEPQPSPVFLAQAEDSQSAPPQAAILDSPFLTLVVILPHGLRPLPPRAPPGAILRLHCVLRC